MEPVLQVALDFLEQKRALTCAREAAAGGATWIEAGTPLIKSEGLDIIRALRKEFPKAYLIADLKIMDAGRMEMEAAAKAGADCATVLGVASDSTIQECAEAGRNYGIDVCVDLAEVADAKSLVKQCEEWGVHHVSIHIPIDEQMRGVTPLDRIREIRAACTLPLAVAGGINTETAAEVVLAGADIVIVGGAINKSVDAEASTRTLIHAIQSRTKVETTLFKRHTEETLRELLEQVSTPNLSDAMHRSGDIPGLTQLKAGTRIVGRAYTVRTYPGDWAKPVEAIEQCEPGDVIIIDAGGVGPAVWGELASESCLQKGVTGVIIHGGIRDVDAINDMDFPAYATVKTPTAGEPKGFGELGLTIRIHGVAIQPGDWIVADDSGIVRVPKGKAVEVANRAMDVLERENRLREEIRRQSTLSEVTDLVRWEKQIVEGLDND
jgi:3-hexulose-6-phosphate synthase/6-phospho-3-hexuloisomerase